MQMQLIAHHRLFHLEGTGYRIRDGKLYRGVGIVPPHRIQAVPDYTGPKCGITGCPTCDRGSS